MKISNIFKETKLAPTETEIFLSSILEKDRSFIIAYPEFEINFSDYHKFKEFEARRKLHEPVAYILGYKDFYRSRIRSDKRAAIPRAETESLIEEAVKFIFRIPNRERKNHLASDPTYKIADVGTGSACIAISLAKILPFAHIFAIDIDHKALSLAEENVAEHNLTNQITLMQGDLLNPISTSVDLIVANLPYIPSHKLNTLETQIKNWEPLLAFDGGTDGKQHYKNLFSQATNKLAQSGIIVYEVDGKANIWQHPFSIYQSEESSRKEGLI